MSCAPFAESIRKTGGHCGCAMALSLTLLAGCAAPAARQPAAPTDRRADSATPREPTAAAPAPAAAQPAEKAPPPSAAAAARPTEADLAAKGKDMSAADRQALIDLIREKAAAAPERKPRETAPQAAQPAPPGATAAPAGPTDAAAPRPREALATVQPRSANDRARTAPPGTATSTAAGESGESGTPRMELSPTDFDFKDVWQGMPVGGEFRIKNVGTAPLTLSTRSSCGCTVATKPQSPLEPGGETSFKISYNTSRAGPADKAVTITTNDPERASVVVKVHGAVKALIAATPAERIFFNDLTPDSVESQTIRLEPKYDTPLKLKLREGQDFGPVEIEFKEVEPGVAYELTATTKPPVKTNKAIVTLETGLSQSPTFPVHVDVNVPAKLTVSPARISVLPAATQPKEQILQVQSRATTPLVITDVKSSTGAVKWELLPAQPAVAGSKSQTQRLRVTLPPYDDVPAEGAALEIYTNDAEEQYRKIDVPIVKSPAATKPAAPRVPPARTGP